MGRKTPPKTQSKKAPKKAVKKPRIRTIPSTKVKHEEATDQANASSPPVPIPETPAAEPTEPATEPTEVEPNAQAPSIPEDVKPAGKRNLRVNLTDHEKQEYGGALAEFVNELEQLEAHRSGIPERIKAVRKRMSEVKAAIRNGYEFRDVECVERFNGGVFDIIRVDTGDVVTTRAPRKDEMQATIFDAIDSKTPPCRDPANRADADAANQSCSVEGLVSDDLIEDDGDLEDDLEDEELDP